MLYLDKMLDLMFIFGWGGNLVIRGFDVYIGFICLCKLMVIIFLFFIEVDYGVGCR